MLRNRFQKWLPFLRSKRLANQITKKDECNSALHVYLVPFKCAARIIKARETKQKNNKIMADHYHQRERKRIKIHPVQAGPLFPFQNFFVASSSWLLIRGEHLLNSKTAGKNPQKVRKSWIIRMQKKITQHNPFSHTNTPQQDWFIAFIAVKHVLFILGSQWISWDPKGLWGKVWWNQRTQREESAQRSGSLSLVTAPGDGKTNPWTFLDMWAARKLRNKSRNTRDPNASNGKQACQSNSFRQVLSNWNMFLNIGRTFASFRDYVHRLVVKKNYTRFQC